MKEKEAEVFTAEEQIEEGLKHPRRNWPLLLLRYLLPLALTVLLVWYMFRKVDFANMMALLRQGVDYWWILCAMGLSIFSHVFRAIRWRLQLRSLGINAPLMALCCSIFGCYALNLIFPRLGEVWRCTYIARREKAPFTTVLGSMVSDRLTDTLSVLLITILTFIVAHGAIQSFMDQYEVGRNILSLLSNPWLWGCVAGAVCFLVGILYYGREVKIINKLLQWLSELWKGFATIWQMKGKWKFAILTVGIWGCFFVQLYVAFFAFDFTRDLCRESSLAYGLVPCLVAFVLSSIGMAVPSNGGLGPWNVGIIFGLAVYGVTETQSTAFSMVQWSGQTIMLILLGIYTMIYISLGSRKR